LNGVNIRQDHDTPRCEAASTDQHRRARGPGVRIESERTGPDRHGIRDFYVVDDIFNVDLKRSMELFDMILAAGLKLRLYFVNGLRADITNEQFVDRAIEAGAVWFTYAVESAAEEIQLLVRKHLNLEKAKKIIAYTQGKNVAVNI